MVTYEGLFMFSSIIISTISLCYVIFHDNKK